MGMGGDGGLSLDIMDLAKSMGLKTVDMSKKEEPKPPPAEATDSADVRVMLRLVAASSSAVRIRVAPTRSASRLPCP